MNNEIKWRSWNPEWGNKAAKHNDEEWEYALIPAGTHGFRVGQWVYMNENDGIWCDANERPSSQDRIVRRPKQTEQPADPHQPGVKLDTGKPRLGLVIKGFGDALTEVAKVATFGAAKYTDDGWRTVPNGIARYTDAKFRHATQSGVDPESGLLHAAHEAWNALAILQLMIEKERDNA